MQCASFRLALAEASPVGNRKLNNNTFVLLFLMGLLYSAVFNYDDILLVVMPEKRLLICGPLVILMILNS